MKKVAPALLALFLDEARQRLEALRRLAPSLGRSEESLLASRRELHALKGAARMLGFGDLAEACHGAEEFLSGELEDSEARWEEVLQGLESLVEGIAGGGPPDTAEEIPDRDGAGAGGETLVPDEVVRVSAGWLDQVSEAAFGVRILALEAGRLIGRVLELSRSAERGVLDADPAQVLAALAASLRRVGLELDRGQRQLLGVARRQISLVRGHQLQPLGPVLERLARHGEELASDLGKRVEVRVEGGEVQVDRKIVAALEESLLHLVRNAVDHGLEGPRERKAAGKPSTGSLLLSARTDTPGWIQLEIEDDGRGLDATKIRRTAVRRGLIGTAEAEALSDRETYQFLFRPGFSTAERVTEVSGRGVGLDAVAASVRRVGGLVELHSEPGAGTRIVLRLPVERRGQRVHVIEGGGGLAAVVSQDIRGFRRGAGSPRGSTGHREVEPVDGSVPVHGLARILGREPGTGDLLVLLSAGEATVALEVDRVLGEEDVVLHPLPVPLEGHPVFDAVTLLPGGRPVPVIAPRLLLSLAPGDLAEGPAVRRTRVLVVDDSPVVREMLRKVFEEGGCLVGTAGSGRDALARMEEDAWDCVVTDIEMPGMDGLELVRRLRGDPRWRHLPVVVVSTADLREQRLAGLEAGADVYLAKQSLDTDELLDTVLRLAGEPGGGGATHG